MQHYDKEFNCGMADIVLSLYYLFHFNQYNPHLYNKTYRRGLFFDLSE